VSDSFDYDLICIGSGPAGHSGPGAAAADHQRHRRLPGRFQVAQRGQDGEPADVQPSRGRGDPGCAGGQQEEECGAAEQGEWPVGVEPTGPRRGSVWIFGSQR